MKKIILNQLLIALLVLPTSVQAKNFLTKWWGPPDRSAVEPYFKDVKLPHQSRWAEDDWTPQDWVDARGGSALNVINGFYEADIIRKQSFNKDVPLLEVGQGFLRLSSLEQRRVMAFIDDTYQVTSQSPAGTIEICLGTNDRIIGVFTADGLQLR